MCRLPISTFILGTILLGWVLNAEACWMDNNSKTQCHEAQGGSVENNDENAYWLFLNSDDLNINRWLEAHNETSSPGDTTCFCFRQWLFSGDYPQGVASAGEPAPFLLMFLGLNGLIWIRRYKFE